MATNWNELARDVKIYKTASNTRKTARGVAVLNQQVAQQTAQLQAMHSDLARLQSLEEQRQRTADYENKLRDLIFEQEVRIQAMRKLVERAPAAVYVATTVLQTQFAQLNVSPSSFQMFADKDRARQFLAELAQNLAEAEAAMTPELKATAEDALRAIELLSRLDELEGHYQSRQEFLAYDAQLRKLRVQRVNARSTQTTLALALAVCTCGLGLLLLANLSPEIKPEEHAHAQMLQNRFSAQRIAELEALLGALETADACVACRDELQDRVRVALIMDREGEPITNPLL